MCVSLFGLFVLATNCNDDFKINNFIYFSSTYY